MMRTLRTVALLTLLAGAGVAGADEGKRVSPYAATEEAVTEAMLDLASVGPADHVVDLGSGDGRIVIAAARRGASGLGVDIDAKLVALARSLAEEAGVAARAKFLEQDLFETDLSAATVVTVYLLPTIMQRVADRLAATLAPGTRVVAHDYPLPGWRVARLTTMDSPAKRDHLGKSTATLYLYVVPARAAGAARR